ncbi:D-2-hydroxyacid dehydrogenase family protein [Sphingomonas beigongshangi]|uniref:D-2-hydroxyacid dehydrogenase family protein n=1 Tax=Sphingomonas beigongshangi TaxID=2782540 RepID=UPI001AEE8F23|nr:D-2-hydroxyacid dehydrogenase family protein [Sphingomonas beigongshangi]
MKRIAVLDDYQDGASVSADWSAIRERADVVVFHDHVDDAQKLLERLKPFDAICVMRERTPLRRPLLEQLPRLRFIASTGPANASIDMDAAAELSITVSSTGGVGSGAPELTWSLILASARHLPQELASVRAGGWQTGVGRDLAGRTLGIIGLGKVGRQVAAVGRAFGMGVIASGGHLTDAKAQEAGVRRVDQDDLLRQADWVSLHLALTPETRGSISARELGFMKPTAWLVNAARGTLVDEAALIAALRAGAIAGAALDVFDTEPLPPDHPFRTLPNVVATPHIGFVTEDTYRIFYGQTVENLLAWLNGAPIRTASA